MMAPLSNHPSQWKQAERADVLGAVARAEGFQAASETSFESAELLQ